MLKVIYQIIILVILIETSLTAAYQADEINSRQIKFASQR